MPRDALPTAETGWRATLALEFERRGERTVLAGKRHEGPLVVQKALHPEGPGTCHAIVVHPPAGIAGGDDLAIDVSVAAGAHAVLTTPGAAKWYRSTGAVARQRCRITAQAGARIEWLPQENIVFDGARAQIAWEANIAADASLIAWDVFCLGRTGSGETFTRGECRLESRLVREGRPVWVERARLRPGHATVDSAAGLDSAPVFGTFITSAPSIEVSWLEACRAETPRSGEGAATLLPHALVARYRGDSTEAARDYFIALWKRLRGPALGAEPVEPRIWRT
jgi:urease accessory protein